MSQWDFEDRYFPPSRPRAAKGGIRAQSQRGGFGESWWAKRWIAVLEGFHLGSRLERGRAYARAGQVLSIDIEKGSITATVQGSRPKPYRISIQVKSLGKPAWKKVAESVAGQAVFASKLLGGEMPREMEEVLRDSGVSLFPERYRDLATDCSCPDSSNPCKHIAAVYYLLGEEFDRDPFLIFRMRGVDREEFMTLLGESGPRSSAVASLPPEPLPAGPRRFWKGGVLPEGLLGESAGMEDRPNVAAGVSQRLGKFPFWRGSLGLQDFLQEAYGQAAAKAAAMLESVTPSGNAGGAEKQ